MNIKHKIILASASKRRSEILRNCGIEHKISVSNVLEMMDEKKGAGFNVLHNARLKAKTIANKHKEGFIIGADTVVLLGNKIIGKPKTKKEARAFLKAFSGKTISVYTGLCVIDVKKERIVSEIDLSKIHVKRLIPKRIDEFVDMFDSYDRAGGFSIEGLGALIFDDIEGSFYNILGLPMMKLDKLFKKLGVDLLRL